MEQRLIDVNSLVKEFDDMGQEIDVLYVLLIIGRQKTVNAVPVVRCGECRRAIPFSVAGNRDEFCYCDLFDATMTRKDFCSYGERKEKTDE